MSSNGSPFAAFAAAQQPHIEAALQSMLPAADAVPAQLHEAMRYVMFPGGKRLRPLLALLGCRVTGGALQRALRPAAALECAHTYSLVHDDLPCMDDDPLRRGRPTCHVVYGEAMAVLVGDALQALALEVAAEAGGPAVRAFARALGSLGMVGGQVMDLAAEGAPAAKQTVDSVAAIHDRKTGALIAASLEVGALAGSGPGCTPEALAALRRYGELLGRAFQVADDCLDLTGTAEEIGKQPGQDVAAGKLTYPALIGLPASRELLHALASEAAALAGEIAVDSAGTGVDERRALLEDTPFFLAARTR